MSTMQDPNQATGNIYINNMTIMSQPQAIQSLSPQIISPGSVPYNLPIQTQNMPSDPYAQMRKNNQNYQTVKQYQQNLTEFQERQNLYIRYQEMCKNPPLPILRGIGGENDNIPNFRNSPLWNVAQWSIASTGLTMLQALCAIITCICAATWARIRISCRVSGHRKLLKHFNL